MTEMTLIFLIGLIFLTPTRTAPQSTDDVVKVTTKGDSVTLPCTLYSGRWCSSVTWSRGEEFGTFYKVVKSERVTILSDCSLHIKNIEMEDARIYKCDDGKMNSTVEILILELTTVQNKANEKEIDMQCYLNNFRGLVTKPCDKTGIQIKWLNEDDTVVKGERFQIRNDPCISKLIIQSKPTDHYRKWKCQISQNGSVKATDTLTTKLPDGIEEVFTAVSESVSFTCTNTSSLALTTKGQTPIFITETSSSTIISNVSSMHSMEYHCIDSNTKEDKRIRLHTIDLISKFDTNRKNVTLTCILTCAKSICDKDFNLTWSENTLHTKSSGLINVSGTLINKLYIPIFPLSPGEIVCSVCREGAQVATKKWQYDTSLHGLAWIALPLGLMCIASTGAYCMYRKKKHKKDPGNIQTGVGMIHIYEDVQDCEPQGKVEAATSTVYSLLQAVN